MRAVQFDSYGRYDVLEVRDVELPDLGPDSVIVQVLATGINPGEAKIREGAMASDHDAFPMGEGSDLAGRIVDVGAEVTGWQVGDEVIGWSDERSAHAEYVAVPAGHLVRKPEPLGWEQAGSLYVAGGTAWALRSEAGLRDGQTAVVTAAAGGVGLMLTQLLVQDGVRVLAVAGSENDDLLRQFGAEPVPRGPDLLSRLRTQAPDGVDAFLDCFGDGYTDLGLQLGVPKDKVVSIADFEAAGRNGTQVIQGYTYVDAAVIEELARLAAEGLLMIPIVATFGLDQVRDAYALLEDGHTHGKIVLVP